MYDCLFKHKINALPYIINAGGEKLMTFITTCFGHNNRTDQIEPTPQPSIGLIGGAHRAAIDSSKWKLLSVVLIILGLFSLGVAGVGLAGLGNIHAWWPAGALNSLNQTHSIAIMTAAGLAGILFLSGGGVLFPRLRISPNQIAPDAELGRILAEVTPPVNRQSLIATLQQEIDLTQHLDAGPTNGRWRRTFPKEKDQTFENFTKIASEFDRQPIHIQLIGKFSKTDRRVIELSMRFLRAFHCVEVHLIDTVWTMEQLEEQSRQACIKEDHEGWAPEIIPQPGMFDNRPVMKYNTGPILLGLAFVRPENCHIVGITSNFLNSSNCTNFVYGSANAGGAIISNYVFGDPEKNFMTVTARMMKILGHEFGHVLSIGHCSAHECNIGGYIDESELDSRPYFYCSKDSAKICLKKGITLQAYYTQLLAYFTSFRDEKRTDFFNREIKLITAKLALLN